MTAAQHARYASAILSGHYPEDDEVALAHAHAATATALMLTLAPPGAAPLDIYRLPAREAR